MLPPLIHLGAVTYSNNNTPYAIRAEVAFDFRDGPQLTSVRLTPLTQPDSPDFVPSAIDLWLHGRWRTALSSLRKRTVVEVQNASVKRSDDADINPVRLELADPAADNVALYVLDESMEPAQMLFGTSLDQGLQGCSLVTRAAFNERITPWASAHEQPRQARVTIAAGPRQYDYTPIRVLSDPEGPIPYDPTKKYNIFGIVVECRAPSIANSGSLRSEIVIADESSTVGVERGEALKSMAVYSWEENPKNAIPFRAIGDVVRVHRVHLKEYNVHGSGERRRSAQAKFYSSIVLWEHEGHDFLPITARDPIRQQSAEHRISSQDRDRVRELRKWAKEYIFRHHKIHRQHLYTPSQVIGVELWGFPSPIDVLCLVEPDTYIDESDGILTFLAAEGFPHGERIKRIAVQSESMQHCEHNYSNNSFIDFCPSWRLRPTGRPAWVLLRDVSIVKRNGETVITLHAGKRTSSIIWNFEDSPDFRNVKSRHPETEMPPQPSPTINPSTVNQGYGYGHVESTAAGVRSTETGHQRPDAHLESRQNEPTNHDNNNAESLSNGHRIGSSNAQQRQSPPKRMRPDGNTRIHSLPGKQRKGNTPRQYTRDPSSGGVPIAQPYDETTVRSLPLRRELHVITSNRHEDKPFSSIAGMLKYLREGNTGAHRLKVTARACSSPKDVRFVCKPWCKRCNKYLKIEATHGQLECLTCRDTFSSTRDPKTEWAYSVKLVLEDSAGGRMDGWIEGNEGATFFSGLPPTNLLNNCGLRRRVSKSLQAVLSSQNRLDCCVKPYEYEDKQGFYRVACKIFATKLLPQYIANDNKD